MKNVFFLAVLLAACEENVEVKGIVTGAKSVLDITTSECKGNSLGKSMDTGYEPQTDVTAEVSGSDILVHLVDVNANCCPSPGAEVSTDGSTITIMFEDVTADEACSCMCWTDFDILVEDPGAGDWEIQVYLNGSLYDTVEITL